jgi:hypothetical protein
MHIITMTKQDTNARAEAAPQGDGAPVEISPEMIKAGVEMIADQYGVCGADIAPDLARDVFIAMWAIKKDRDRN